jgi:hypothetical protein
VRLTRRIDALDVPVRAKDLGIDGLGSDRAVDGSASVIIPRMETRSCTGGRRPSQSVLDPYPATQCQCLQPVYLSSGREESEGVR